MIKRECCGHKLDHNQPVATQLIAFICRVPDNRRFTGAFVALRSEESTRMRCEAVRRKRSYDKSTAAKRATAKRANEFVTPAGFGIWSNVMNGFINGRQCSARYCYVYCVCVHGSARLTSIFSLQYSLSRSALKHVVHLKICVAIEMCLNSIRKYQVVSGNKNG